MLRPRSTASFSTLAVVGVVVTLFACALLCTAEDEPFSFVPQFIASLRPDTSAVWSSPCFNSAMGHFDLRSSSSSFDGGEFVFSFQNRTHLLCTDHYLLATRYTAKIVSYSALLGSGDHSVVFKWKNNDELEDAVANGIRTFLFDESLLQIMESFVLTAEMFVGTQRTTMKENVKFLAEKGLVLQPRSSSYTPMAPSDIHSGDTLAVLKLSGEGGGSDTLIAWGTNGTIGHAALCLWMEDGQLYVTESRGSAIGGNSSTGLLRTPYQEWIDENVDMDALIVLMRLTPEAAAAFNASAATEYWHSVAGLPYGYENFLFGWIDTEEGNFPYPLSSQLGTVGYSLLDIIDPGLAATYIGQALNNRLGTSGLNATQIFAEVTSRNMTFMNLVIEPELDSYRYNNGEPSLVCDVYVLSALRAGGVFGSVGAEFQASELTTKDLYRLNIFAQEWDMPATCKSTNAQNPGYCQLIGDYVLELPGFSTVTPFPDMFQTCASDPAKGC